VCKAANRNEKEEVKGGNHKKGVGCHKYRQRTKTKITHETSRDQRPTVKA